jgi:hypothetical protein
LFDSFWEFWDFCFFINLVFLKRIFSWLENETCRRNVKCLLKFSSFFGLFIVLVATNAIFLFLSENRGNSLRYQQFVIGFTVAEYSVAYAFFAWYFWKFWEFLLKRRLVDGC